jgi:poly-beta-1,6-N-acetyl-D-glucosamine biosynthesis protein PgaD
VGVGYLLVQGGCGDRRRSARTAVVAGHRISADPGHPADLFAGSVAIGAVLLVWAKYSEKRASGYERRERMSDVCEVGLSESFQVSLAILDCLQN